MNDFSLIEKLSMLMKLISSSSLFLICMIIGILLLTSLIICIILNKKVNKWLFIGVFTLVLILLLINYGSIIIKILDIILDSVFVALYFPNLSIYTTVLLVINIMFIISMLSKKQLKSIKITNIVCTILFDFLLILIIETVRVNKINIYEEVTLFTDSNLLILLELSMGIFVSWILANLFISAHSKLKKYDEKDLPVTQEIVFEEIKE